MYVKAVARVGDRPFRFSCYASDKLFLRRFRDSMAEPSFKPTWIYALPIQRSGASQVDLVSQEEKQLQNIALTKEKKNDRASRPNSRTQTAS